MGSFFTRNRAVGNCRPMNHQHPNFPTSGREVKKQISQGVTFRVAYLRINERFFSVHRIREIFLDWVDFDPSEIRNIWKHFSKQNIFSKRLDFTPSLFTDKWKVLTKLKRKLPTHWIGTSAPLAQKLNSNLWPRLRAHWTQSENMLPLDTNFPTRVEFYPL